MRNGNFGVIGPSQRVPTVEGEPPQRGNAMTATTTQRKPTTWVCDNCHAETAVERKRCTDCGTSRY